jgi:hypothetical protein
MRRLGSILLVVAVAAGCRGADDGLVFRRADGSRIEMPGTPIAWCGRWSNVIPARSLQVAAVGGIERQPGQEWFSYWRLWAIVDDVRGGKPVQFPNNFVWNRPRRAELFVGDSETGNEASTKQERSGGEVVFSQADCEVGAPVEFEIDALVGSEFGDAEPIAVEGTFRGVVAEPPPGYGH